MEIQNNEQKKSGITRRSMIQKTAIGVATLAGAGVLAACSSPTTNGGNTGGGGNTTGNGTATILDPKAPIDYKTATNFNAIPDNETQVGTTADNLLAAITGEIGATTKYEAYASAASQAGYSQIARLFQATADAEKIHIELEFTELQKIDPDAVKPDPPTVQTHKTDINLILSTNGEIYETSDMYPLFIKAATDSGDDDVAFVFARAKLAESVHAQRYLEAYNNIDNPDDDTYYLCPVCGYIHKGENFKACPICLTPKDACIPY